MKLNELIYFQAKNTDTDEVSFVLKPLVGFVEKKDSSEPEDLQGLYLKQNKYGRFFYKKIVIFDPCHLDQNTFLMGSQGFLAYKYLSITDCRILLEQIKKMVQFDGVYLLAHSCVHFEQSLRNLVSVGVPLSAIKLFVSSETKSHFIESRYSIGIRPGLEGVELLPLSLPQQHSDEAQNKILGLKAIFFSFFFIQLMKYILNPFIEIKKLIEKTQVLQSIYLTRVKELIYFIGFILNLLFLKSYYFLHGLFGFLKVVLVKFFYSSRHIALMSNFKLFGCLVDSYHFMVRLFLFVKYSILSRMRHHVLMCFFSWYGHFFDFMAKIYYEWYVAFLRHEVLMFYYKLYGLAYDLVIAAGYRLRHRILMACYKIRHLILMSCFKCYGYLVDVFHILYRVFTFYLPYPVFKIYWFLKYQYNSRLKGIWQSFRHDS